MRRVFVFALLLCSLSAARAFGSDNRLVPDGTEAALQQLQSRLDQSNTNTNQIFGANANTNAPVNFNPNNQSPKSSGALFSFLQSQQHSHEESDARARSPVSREQSLHEMTLLQQSLTTEANAEANAEAKVVARAHSHVHRVDKTQKQKGGKGGDFTPCHTCVFVLERIKKGNNMLLPAICSEVYKEWPDSYSDCHQVLNALTYNGNNVRYWLFEGCFKYEVYRAKEWIKPCPSHVMCSVLKNLDGEPFCEPLPMEDPFA